MGPGYYGRDPISRGGTISRNKAVPSGQKGDYLQGYFGCPWCTVRVFLIDNQSYDPVRCGFTKAEVLHCGSVWFSDLVNATVLYGAVSNCKCYGAVLVVLNFGNPTVRFGGIFRNQESYGAVRCSF